MRTISARFRASRLSCRNAIRALLFIALAAVVAACATETPSASSLAAATPTPIVVATATAVATPAPFTFGDGTYQVGVDLQAGTYEALHAGTNFTPCVWQRLSGLGGSDHKIIASGSDHDGTAIVTISESDKGFTSNHCGTWAAPTAITASPTAPFSNGAYIVGLDIAAGRWQSATLLSSKGLPLRCSWQRLSGFGGTPNDDVITSGSAFESEIVTIAEADKGFIDHGCGLWTR